MRIVVVALVVISALGGAGVWVQTNRLEREQAHAVALQLSLKASQRALAVVQERAEQADRLQADLRLKIDHARSLADARRATIRRLERENKDFRAWRGAALPDDAVRLFDRSAVFGAGDYRNHMPGGHPVPSSGIPPGNER